MREYLVLNNLGSNEQADISDVNGSDLLLQLAQEIFCDN